MKISTLPVILVATVSLSGCSSMMGSSLNPLNWFGGGSSVASAATGQDARPLVPEGAQSDIIDNRQMIESILEARAENGANGVLLRATGVASTQGQFNAQLVPISNEGGTLTFAFRTETPAGAQMGGDVMTRTIVVVKEMSNAELAGVSRIVVQGATNARTAVR